jgi:hypothetical protein
MAVFLSDSKGIFIFFQVATEASGKIVNQLKKSGWRQACRQPFGLSMAYGTILP